MMMVKHFYFIVLIALFSACGVNYERVSFGDLDEVDWGQVSSFTKSLKSTMHEAGIVSLGVSGVDYDGTTSYQVKFSRIKDGVLYDFLSRNQKLFDSFPFDCAYFNAATDEFQVSVDEVFGRGESSKNYLIIVIDNEGKYEIGAEWKCYEDKPWGIRVLDRYEDLVLLENVKRLHLRGGSKGSNQ